MHMRNREDVDEKSFQLMIKDIWTKTVMILKPPFLCRTIVMCLIACFVTSSYYTLTLWLPELFHRYADFQEMYPNQTASVCTLNNAKNSTAKVSVQTLKVFSLYPTFYVPNFIVWHRCCQTTRLIAIPEYKLAYSSIRSF